MIRGIIGIASIKEEVENRKLPIAKVYVSKEGKYCFLERKILDEAIAKSLKNLETEIKSLVLVAVEIVPVSERKR